MAPRAYERRRRAASLAPCSAVVRALAPGTTRGEGSRRCRSRCDFAAHIAANPRLDFRRAFAPFPRRRCSRRPRRRRGPQRDATRPARPAAAARAPSPPRAACARGRRRASKIVAQRVADRAHARSARSGVVAVGSSSTAMLMIPPALATKSGAQRMPARGEQVGDRRRRRAGCWRRRRSRGSCSARHACRRRARRRARTGRARRPRRSAPRRARPARAEPSAQRALALSTSATTSFAPPLGEEPRQPRRRRCRGRRPRRVRPSRSSCRTRARRRRAARLDAERGPGLGSPEPPRSPGRPVTWLVRLGDRPSCRAHRGADVLGRDVARRASASTVSPKSSSTSRGARPWGSAVGRAEHDHALAAAEREARRTAALNVIARDSRSASRDGRRARRRSVHIRHPPRRGAARRRVDRDDAVQAGAPPAADQQLLVLEGDGGALHCGARR